MSYTSHAYSMVLYSNVYVFIYICYSYVSIEQFICIFESHSVVFIIFNSNLEYIEVRKSGLHIFNRSPL